MLAPSRNEKVRVHVGCVPLAMILLPWPSGIVYDVTCNGKCTQQRHIEGVCLPLDARLSLTHAGTLDAHLEELHPGCDGEQHTWHLSGIEANAIDQLLHAYRQPLSVIRAAMNASCEAWVHVRIEPTNDGLLRPFVGHDAILIWENCSIQISR